MNFPSKLDRNGYAPSIIPGHDEHTCWRCGRNGAADPLNRHEVFHEDFGGKYRKRSKEAGLWVHLCHRSCHLYGVHADHEFDLELKREAQRCAMEYYGWDTEVFTSLFGKNYLGDVE